MKNLVWMAMLLVGMTSLAQEKKGDGRTEKMERPEWTPEQKKQLRIKELTLALDLSPAQQAEMSKIIAEQQVKGEQYKAERKKWKESGKKPTSDEKFVMKNKMLDEKIAMKERLKKILNTEQLAKYEKMNHSKKNKMKRFSKTKRMKADKKG